MKFTMLVHVEDNGTTIIVILKIITCINRNKNKKKDIPECTMAMNNKIILSHLTQQRASETLEDMILQLIQSIHFLKQILEK